MLGRTDSRLSGITRSPWDPALTPGGSSGGASASVAAGITTLAIGTDMGGSTRLPAAYTGLVGMRPSTGRIPRRYGFPATCIDFQVIGPFARTMRDMRLLYGVLAGPDSRDPYSERFPPAPDATPRRRIRIGWFTAIGDEGATPEVAASIAAAAVASKPGQCELRDIRRGLLRSISVRQAKLPCHADRSGRSPDRGPVSGSLAHRHLRQRAGRRRTRPRDFGGRLCRRTGCAGRLAGRYHRWCGEITTPRTCPPPPRRPGGRRTKHRPVSRPRHRGCLAPGSTRPGCRGSAFPVGRIPTAVRSAYRSWRRSVMMPSLSKSPNGWRTWHPGRTGGRRWRHRCDKADLARWLRTRGRARPNRESELRRGRRWLFRHRMIGSWAR